MSTPHSSHVAHHEVQEVSVELVQVSTDTVVEHDNVHSGSHAALESHVLTEPTITASDNMPTTTEQITTVLQQQVVHPSKNIQNGLDLWDRVRQYDERAATEDFTLVLKRKQKLKIKVQQVLAKKPPKTRARGGHQSTDQ